jgi:hypothetical protein
VFQFIKIGRALAAMKAAIESRSLTDIEVAAEELAALAGLSREVEAFLAIVNAARVGDIVATLKAAGAFLLLVAATLAGPVAVFARADDDGPKLAAVAECVRLAQKCGEQ